MTRPRVLIVEDEALLAMTLEDCLVEWGFEVVGPAMTLADASELATSASFDMAILDVNIGGEASFGVAALIAKRGIPFIFATGYGTAAQDEAGPGVTVVHKPYRANDLREAVTNALARRPEGPHPT